MKKWRKNDERVQKKKLIQGTINFFANIKV